MTVDRKTAKLLCEGDEFQLYEMSQKRKLESLTEVELAAAVTRSRTLRDKWQDVSRAQRRSVQSAQGARQTSANARSEEKAAMFADIHQLFVARQQAVQSNQVSVPAGKRPLKVARQDRKIVHRAERSVVRGELKKTKNAANRAARAKEPSAATTDAAPPEASSATPSSAAPKKSPASRQTKGAKKTVKSKGASLAKARTKRLAKKAARPVAQSTPTSASKSKSKSPKGTSSIAASRNPNLSAKTTKNIIASGGGKRLQAHVSSVGKRTQARRDSKKG
jgi:hypothetical protein